MDEVVLDSDEFQELVEIFRILKGWREDRDASLMIESLDDEPPLERMG